MSLLDIGVATIFAREFLEGGIIVGNYRTVINKSDEIPEEEKRQKLRAVSVAAAVATVVAVVMILAVAIPLGIASKNFDNRVAEIIEGVSKLVAAIAILGLSLKIPVWLGVYEKGTNLPGEDCHCFTTRKEADEEQKEELLTVREIRFNVAWNIWREVAECGVFLLPYFLQREGIKAIPLSALIGVAISLVITLGFFYANARMTNKVWIAVIMCSLTALLAIGLFSGGCHEFEEVLCLPPGSGGLVEGEGISNTPVVEGTEGACAEREEGCQGDEAADEGIFEGGRVSSGAVETEGDSVVSEEAEEEAGEEGEAGTEGRRLLAEAEGAAGGENYCTPVMYRIQGRFWDQDRFPMALFKPFGYSSKPTVLQTAAWWVWFALTVILHGYKWMMTKKIRSERAEERKAQFV